ncbi:trafficking protein particle complex subunit 10-like [Pagrus major]|uniref:trafficking protein particle complex subunit 10-like n=1 Tax=Pagrus major TaxID=143350 RepID=UPI003CC8442A
MPYNQLEQQNTVAALTHPSQGRSCDATLCFPPVSSPVSSPVSPCVSPCLKRSCFPKEVNKALLTFPFLHIYWTYCRDTEVYKGSVKEEMMQWQNSLRAHGSADWVIIIVEANGNKKKNKTNILPRSSIMDMRCKFCKKQNNRCVVLSDPLKDSSPSQESCNSLLLKLQTHLLMSFTTNLAHFEDDMRTL